MNLNHTPAHTMTTPDSYYDTDTGITYTVTQDDWAEDPRDLLLENYNHEIFIYASDMHSFDHVPQVRNYSSAVNHFWDLVSEEGIDPDVAADNVSSEDAEHDLHTMTLRGYSQSDWCDVVVVCPTDDTTWSDSLRQYKQYLYGDVYTVDCDLPGTESLAGIYADDDEEAIGFYIANEDLTADRIVGSAPELRLQDVRDRLGDHEATDVRIATAMIQYNRQITALAAEIAQDIIDIDETEG